MDVLQTMMMARGWLAQEKASCSSDPICTCVEPASNAVSFASAAHRLHEEDDAVYTDDRMRDVYVRWPCMWMCTCVHVDAHVHVDVCLRVHVDVHDVLPTWTTRHGWHG
jgi:hypothetical protein